MRTDSTPAPPAVESLLPLRRPRVLVLLAAYNGAQWIEQQVQSILAQQDVHLRIIVRDDGSRDSTRPVLDALGGDGRITTVLATTPSGSAAQNFLALIRGNAAVGFDFVAFADQDDIWDANKLARACHALTTDRSAGYSSATTAAWPDGRRSLLSQVRIPGHSDFLFEGAGQGCTFVLAAGFYEQVRKFVSSQPHLTRKLHYHDWALYALARAWDLPWRFDPEPSVLYRQHASNDTGARHSLAGVHKRISRIRDGWYKAQLQVVAELCAAAAPDNATVTHWRNAFLNGNGWRRRLRIVRFCLRGGRRKALDNTILILAAAAGWI